MPKSFLESFITRKKKDTGKEIESHTKLSFFWEYRSARQTAATQICCGADSEYSILDCVDNTSFYWLGSKCDHSILAISESRGNAKQFREWIKALALDGETIVSALMLRR
jgi:hypothetical protein